MSKFKRIISMMLGIVLCFTMTFSNGVSRGKICEFGYLITDENFNKIESAEYIINPKAPFDEYVLNNMLAYPKKCDNIKNPPCCIASGGKTDK